ncbi:hypothetical protein H6P81_006083 [Aristolochia fimbriata]|uniref:CCHC-type domain-containing protein n=1 Tax=Aristolochia fimbriata TaxID=158543 RepID=A0AAV7EXD6_ARIFI|nr:hypothetical protein H6P81_006083 [Aristolochia fimbriata]
MEVLEVHIEGTESVRLSKLQMLTTQFELLSMHEDETILQYEEKITDIANRAATLGDKILENRLVRKVLRSLCLKFKVKRIVIEENKVVDKMSMDELISSLKIFEMNEEASDSSGGRKKSDMTFKSVVTEEKGQDGDSSISPVTLTELDERVALLAQGLNRFMKKNKKKSFKPSEYKQAGSSTTKVTSKKKVVLCYECGGRGRIQSECPTYLRKKKYLVASWSEDDSSDSNSEDCNFVAFIASYKQSYILEYGLSNIKNFVCEHDSDDESGERSVKNILKQWDGGRKYGDTHGLGYSTNNDSMVFRAGKRRFVSVCDHCGKYGHIIRCCYRLLCDWKRSGSRYVKRTGSQLIWVNKEIELYATHYALKATTKGVWYFDSGCS